MQYPELHAHSCYSFLDGASQPEEMALRAAELGYSTLALTDHDSLSGSLEFANAAHDAGLRPITGCELTLIDGAHLTLLVENERGYRNLCRLITAAHRDDRRAPRHTLDQVAQPRRRAALPLWLCPPGGGRSAGGPGAACVRPSASLGSCEGSSAATASRSRSTGPTGAATPAATGF